MDKKGKMEFLNIIEEDEERFFHDYSEELNILIHDTNSEIRAKAVLCLWNYPTTHFLKFLLDTAINDTDEEVRKNTIIILGRFIFEGSMEGYDLELNYPVTTEDITKDDYNQVKNILLRIFKDESKPDIERRYALEALSFASEDEIEELILNAYNNRDKLFKQSAVFSMGRNGSGKWNDIILNELNNSDKDILLEAVLAAGEARIDKACSELVNLTYSEDPDIVKSAIWSLGQTGCDEGLKRLYELSENGNRDIQEIANEAIEEWHSISGNYEEDYDEDMLNDE
jgi:HEAT repeat protein